MKLKAVVTCVLAASVAIGAISLTACNGNGYSETYAGTISEQSYTSQQLAIQAFLTEELSTSSENATYVSYEKQGDISQKEINSLAIPTAERESITSAEKGTILYTLSSDTANTLYAADDPTLCKGVYILNMGNAYRYYDPIPAIGEALSNSYLQSVLSSDSYTNCTMEMKLFSETTTQGKDLTISYDLVCKITDKVVGIDLSVTAAMSDKSKTKTMKLFVVDDNGSVKAVFENKGTYVLLPDNEYDDYFLNVDSTDELAEMSMPRYLDASYFEKTDTGFKMKDNKVFDYIWEYAKASGYGGCIISKAEGSFDFRIKEGRICEGTSTCSINMGDSFTGVMVYANSTNSYKYYDFGKTTVTLPDDAKLALGISE